MTFRTSPPRKNSAPRLDSESMTSVNCGSRPHHCRTTSRVAADQRVCPTTGCSTSPRAARSHRARDRVVRCRDVAFVVGRRCPRQEVVHAKKRSQPARQRRSSAPRLAGKIPLVSTECLLQPYRRRAGATAGSRPRSGAPTSASVSSAPRSTSSPMRGYHRTSVEDIVRSAHTSRTAFYAFFDNREAAMYARAASVASRTARIACARHLRTAGPETQLIEVGVTAFVNYLVSDPAAARILLLEGIGTSPEVNELRARVRSRSRRNVRDIWADSTRKRRRSPQASAVAVGVFGLLLESMLHLVETGRLDEAPAHIPALVSAVERMLAVRPRHGRRLVAASSRFVPADPAARKRMKLRHRHAGADAAPAGARRVGGDRHLRRRGRHRPRGRGGSAITTAPARSTSGSPRAVAETAGRPLLGPARDVRGPRARTRPTIRFAVARAGARLPPSARDREALRHARRGQRRPRDPRRRCRVTPRGVRSPRRAVHDRGARADDAMRALRAALSQREPEYHGAFYDFEGFVIDPHARQHACADVGRRAHRALAASRGRARRRLGAVRSALRTSSPRCSHAARDTDAWAARSSNRSTSCSRTSIRSTRSANPNASASSSRSSRAIGATGVNVRFVHHSPAHYREQLAALAAIAGIGRARDG